MNLIHVDDLATICLAALRHGKPGETYNVSDGTPRTWKEIYDHIAPSSGLTRLTANADQQTGKRISTRKLKDALGPSIHHPDLYAEAVKLEKE